MDLHLPTGLVADPECKRHLTGPGHPECPQRYDSVYLGLQRAGLLDQLEKIPARQALPRELGMCHTRAYLDLVLRDCAAGRSTLSTGDTPLSPGTLPAALYAAGGVMNAVDAVVGGAVKNAFCLVRPPGHHATPTHGMGFCVYNNAALAARHAQERHGIERVLILDWDLHHGNGTQDIFYDDPTVFYCSTHQAPLYPGTGHASETGRGEGRGTTLNLPFPDGTDGPTILEKLRETLLPAMADFRPELAVISAGFDSRGGDPLGGFTLTDDDYRDLTRMVIAIAREHAAGRIVSVLEGGYNLFGLAAASAAHVGVLAEEG